MPELAEVEYYRKQWDAGMGARVLRVALHAGKRPLRGLDAPAVSDALTGTRLLGSEAKAKQMLFWFGSGKKPQAWLGVHLGMTGKVSAESADHTPDKHDHLVLYQKELALVFRDPRQFGRIRFHAGAEAPQWWTDLPPAVTSAEFTLERVKEIAGRRGRTAVKALLLMQEFFPGVGNWMADEILWQARVNPKVLSGKLTGVQIRDLWKSSVEVCRIALETVGKDFSDPPEGWLFHARWTSKGHCPRCDLGLKTATIGGRTTRWCPRCQK